MDQNDHGNDLMPHSYYTTSFLTDDVDFQRDSKRLLNQLHLLLLT